ncbi:MAG TPA: PQQ-binding-like beta-propeller repeat protein [Abditibacteriaceae bacterium]|nr:PQQ-binding-like beta-propeller repeat protein [Abditibacteriaceae bacterium]
MAATHPSDTADTAPRQPQNSASAPPLKVVGRRPPPPPLASLDPYGIYGTRTANRMRQARRRRNMQKAGLVLFLILMLVVWAVVTRMPRRSPVIASDWKLNLMLQPSAPPVWAGDEDGVLLVPTDTGRLWAIKPRRETVPATLPQAILATAFPLRAQPLVVASVAYVPCEDGALYAVSWQTGRTLWSHDTGAPMTTRPALSRVEVRQSGAAPQPGKSQAIVIAGNDAGQVVALEASTGRVLWQRLTAAPIGNGITASRDEAGRPLILVPLLSSVATRGGLWCLDAHTGVPLWKFPGSGQVVAAQLAPPAVAVRPGSSHVYCVDDAGAVFCLDLKTGRYEKGMGWKSEARPVSSAGPDDLVMLRGEPLLKQYSWGHRLIVGGNDGGVRCFDARDGSLQWTFEAGDAVRCRPRTLRWGPANAPRDLLLIGCDGPAIYILDARDGSLRWKLRTDGPAFDGPLLAGDSWLALTANGVLQSFSTPD